MWYKMIDYANYLLLSISNSGALATEYSKYNNVGNCLLYNAVFDIWPIEKKKKERIEFSNKLNDYIDTYYTTHQMWNSRTLRT